MEICEHLPQIARQAHRFALVRSVSYPNADHPFMSYYTLTGRVSQTPLGANTVLHGCSFRAQEFEIAAVLGLNGAGKSVSLKVAAGIVPAWSGRVLLHGEDVAFEARHRLADASEILFRRSSCAHSLLLPVVCNACARARRVCTRTISRL